MHAKLIRPVACVAALLFFHAQMVYGQAPAAPAPAAPAAAPAAAPSDQQSPVFKPEELDQILAPIALYPDDLLAQVLMAATYPLEIVQADRWVRDPANAKLKGDQLATALDQQTWDPSVKSLVPFPDVLRNMSDKLDWTQKLGDAVLAQEQDVMASVQRLRKLAQNAGKLETSPQQTVTTQDQAIVIQPANPQTVYVPSYDPGVAYGSWPYPTYPPYSYPPPYGGYLLGGAMAFAAGVAVGGALWGWGNCNWHGGNININNNQFNNINRNNINAGRATAITGNNANWRHDPSHRGGVAYRDPQSRQNFQRASTSPANARQNFGGFQGGAAGGGRAGAGTIGAGGAGAARPGAGAGVNRPGAGAGAATRPAAGAGANRPGAAGGAGAGVNRPGGGAGAGAATRPATGGGISRPAGGAGAGAAARPAAPAFNGMSNGRSANTQAARGAASRSGGFSGGGGGARAGGGGARAGGGGGGRGGGGGGRR